MSKVVIDLNLNLAVDQQPLVAAILSELPALKDELASAQATLREADAQKKQYFQRRANASYHSSLATDEAPVMPGGDGLPDITATQYELNHHIDMALDGVKAVQAKLADHDYRLTLARKSVQAALAEATIEFHRDWLESFASMADQVARHWEIAARILGDVAQKFPVGQSPLSPGLLQGNNAVVAKKIRKAVAR